MVDGVNDDELMPSNDNESILDQLNNNAWLFGLVAFGAAIGIVGMDLGLVAVIAITLLFIITIAARDLIDF
jgi:hypothetical protein